MKQRVFVLGSFVADVAFRMSRLPAWGETLMGDTFALGPGGKGSNQAVAAAKAVGGAGMSVKFLSKVGDDAFGQLARTTWAAAGVDASLVKNASIATGAAAILIDSAKGENAIIVVPGACFTLTPAEVDEAGAEIRLASVFLTQLELALDTVERGLQLAREAGVPTILNPAGRAAGAFGLLCSERDGGRAADWVAGGDGGTGEGCCRCVAGSRGAECDSYAGCERCVGCYGGWNGDGCAVVQRGAGGGDDGRRRCVLRRFRYGAGGGSIVAGGCAFWLCDCGNLGYARGDCAVDA